MRQCLIASLHPLMLSSALTGALCLAEPPVRGQEPTGGEEPPAGEPPAKKNDAEPGLSPEQLEEMMREPPSHLAEMPALRIDSSKYEATTEQHDEIKRLIEELTQIEKPDYGMAPWMSGSQFAPVKSSQTF